jgi:membrane protein YqaA with SNARE-associated domain
MKIFQKIYDQTLSWAEHRYAQVILCLVGFSESVFFPIPPDVMLAPMALSTPKKAWYLAGLTTLASAIGGAVGYALGYWLYEPVALPFVEAMHYQDKMQHIQHWFSEYGVWIVFVAGFSPIPYKVFTVSAGLMQMAFFPFFVASVIGRGSRFFLVAGLMYWGGEKMRDKLREIVDLLGWGVVILIAIGVLLYKLQG